MKVHYCIELVGGPYDGADGLALRVTVDDASDELPDTVWAFTCRGQHCHAAPHTRVSHTCVTAGEHRPPSAVSYGLHMVDSANLSAVYAIGDVSPTHWHEAPAARRPKVTAQMAHEAFSEWERLREIHRGRRAT